MKAYAKIGIVFTVIAPIITTLIVAGGICLVVYPTTLNATITMVLCLLTFLLYQYALELRRINKIRKYSK